MKKIIQKLWLIWWWCSDDNDSAVRDAVGWILLFGNIALLWILAYSAGGR